MPKFQGLSFLCASAAIAIGLAAAPAGAAQLGVDFASTVNTASPNVYDLGYAFEDLTSTAVTGLGVFDGGSLSNLGSTYQLGLWNCGSNVLVPCTSGNPLIASASIDPSSAAGVQQIGQWAFIAITPVTLNAGTFYAVGAQEGDAGAGLDTYASGDDITVDSDIKYLNDLFSDAGVTLVEPTFSEGDTSTLSAGYFGGNIEFGPTTVPEPASLALLGSALAGLGLFGRRKRTKA